MNWLQWTTRSPININRAGHVASLDAIETGAGEA